MVLQVDHELCAGCGLCIEACSVDAIQLVNQRAVIDDVLCTDCKACIEVCPNRAILVLSTPAPSMIIATLPVTEPRIIPVQSEIGSPKKISPSGGIVPLTVTALAFLGRELTPRLVDVLVTALEHRLQQPGTTAVTQLSTNSKFLTTQNRGKQRQARRHGRHRNYRNQ